MDWRRGIVSRKNPSIYLKLLSTWLVSGGQQGRKHILRKAVQQKNPTRPREWSSDSQAAEYDGEMSSPQSSLDRWPFVVWGVDQGKDFTSSTPHMRNGCRSTRGSRRSIEDAPHQTTRMIFWLISCGIVLWRYDVIRCANRLLPTRQPCAICSTERRKHTHHTTGMIFWLTRCCIWWEDVITCQALLPIEFRRSRGWSYY